MFICSFKLNKTRFLSGAAAVCLALMLVFMILPSPDGDTTTSGDISAKTQQDMVDFLEKKGYTVTEQAILIEEVIIPETFDTKYTEYNELQKTAGFDLSTHAGKTAKKYTFKVLDYEDHDVEVVANVLVLDDKIIGGDLSSTALGGFCRGLVEAEKSDHQNTDENKANETKDETDKSDTNTEKSPN